MILNTKIPQDEEITLDCRKKAPRLTLGESTVIGTREYQQDKIVTKSYLTFQLAAVCDGMGGMRGGERASSRAAEILEQDFLELDDSEDPAEFLRSEAIMMDRAVFSLKDEIGDPLDGGTTCVAVIVKKNLVYWMSVGDSRIYFIRKGEIHSLTREHNYDLTLQVMKEKNLISEEEYLEETKAKGEALISYIGMGDLSLIDGNEDPIYLERGDMLLLCSDGLYKSVMDEDILKISQTYYDVQEAAVEITRFAMGQNRPKQDNTSVILLRYA